MQLERKPYTTNLLKLLLMPVYLNSALFEKDILDE